MRAVLFARATATTRLGRRRRSPITQGSALVAFERSRLALAPLISRRRKYRLPRFEMPPRRAGVLSRHEAQPRRKLASAGEPARLHHHRSDRGGNDRANAG